MADKVLYFPYIRVPESTWFTQTLLYWDEVGTITPSEFVNHPERLGDYTRSLVEQELVNQVFPGAHIQDIPRFDDAFAEYVENLGDDLDRRRTAFKQGSNARIHAEKMGLISDYLVNSKPARNDNYPWFLVEEDTARHFMGYLAAVLGKHPALPYLPITDSEEHLSHFVTASSSAQRANQLLKGIRRDVLSDVLPAPTQSLNAEQIRAFKDRHGNKLTSFRRTIEAKLIEIADIQDDDLRQARLRLFKETTVDEIEAIQDAFKSSGFMNTFCGKICSIVAAFPGVSSCFGLASAVYGAFSKEPENYDSSPLLYAAFAQKELLTH